MIEGKKWNKQEESVWIGRGGSFSAIAIPLRDIPGGKETSENINRRASHYTCFNQLIKHVDGCRSCIS